MIRRASGEDAVALAELMTQLGYPSSEREMRLRWETIGADPHLAAFVAEEDGAVRGMIGLNVSPSFEHNDPTGIILALAVEQETRRRGLGRQLVAAAEEFFRARGVRRVILNTRFEREDAHRFYEALGFTKTGFRFGKEL
jgi:ribosomal protein S18 acetylase RimI-like enzyme